MTAYLDDAYFGWLYAQIAPSRSRSPSRTYWNLCRLLYTKEFYWFVPNDDNRLTDGKELRNEFLQAEGIDVRDQQWMNLECSMFELIIGLSHRLAFETDTKPHIWFWELMENLDLHKYNDRANIPPARVTRILERVIWRTYEFDGTGGLFPLVYPEYDQRWVELWYQLGAYLLERGY